MSGRLKISGKKSYCPWKAENVARVRADEEAHRARQQRNQVRQETGLLEQQWKSMRQQNGEDPLHHVNLFEKEEQEALWQEGEKIDQKSPSTKKDDFDSKQIPFYLKAPQKLPSGDTGDWRGDDATVKLRRKEGERKQRLDPMSALHQSEHNLDKDRRKGDDTKRSREERKRNDAYRQRKKRRSALSDESNSDESSSREQRRERKHKRKRDRQRKEHRKMTDAVASVSVQELRRKRLEREQLEKQRQRDMLRK